MAKGINMSDVRFTLENPLYIRHILTESMKCVMHDPCLKADFVKVAEAGAVLGEWYKEYVLAVPDIVKDVLSKPRREWQEVWCRPEIIGRGTPEALQ